MPIKTREIQTLRTIIKEDMKVLRTEVAGRVDDLIEEALKRIDQEFSQDEKRVKQDVDRMRKLWTKFCADIKALSAECKAKTGVTVRAELSGYTLERREFDVEYDNEEKNRRRQKARDELRREQRDALLTIDRTERDMTRRVSIEGLESEEARELLQSMPTVMTLVTGSRVKELTT